MSLLETVSVQCPCCWESIELVVDCSVPGQEYTEDCSVCCQPLVLSVEVDAAGEPSVGVRPEQE